MHCDAHAPSGSMRPIAANWSGRRFENERLGIAAQCTWNLNKTFGEVGVNGEVATPPVLLSATVWTQPCGISAHR